MVLGAFHAAAALSRQRLVAEFVGPTRHWLFNAQARYAAQSWQVSSMGRVRSSRGVISVGHRGASAYLQVQIARQNYCVHRLVAAAFLDAPPVHGVWQVNHVDGDCTNNRADNLRWVTTSENVRCSYETSPNRVRPGRAILWRRHGENGANSWKLSPSRARAACDLKVDCSTIARACRDPEGGCDVRGTRYEIKNLVLQDLAELSLEDESWRIAQVPSKLATVPNLLVSCHGRVFSSSARCSYVSKGTLSNTGYYRIRREGGNLLVHRIVAATFLGQPASPNFQVNHKDMDRQNNHVNNLEYVTPAENAKHAWDNNACVGRSRKARAVVATPLGSDAPPSQFESITAASLHTGVPRKKVSEVCHGERGALPNWNFNFAAVEDMPGEEWRTVVLERSRSTRQGA